MKLDCRRCGAPVPIPPEALAAAEATVICPGCGARYTRRPSSAAPHTATAVAPSKPPPPAERPPASAPSSSTPPTAVARPTSWPSSGLGEHTIPPPPGAGASGRSLATRSEPLPVFRPEQLVGGRYRVLRFIARGGMGEVYEVEDLELRERLALKTIHPKTANEEGAIERFKREIHLARRVTHPNVCRIFDVGYDDSLPGGAVIFLTMELLSGETLASRLRREGRMSAAEAEPLVRQMAEALAAAHAVGIVHRDFKSENVFLVPAVERSTSASSGDQPRVVVTDFGVARGERDEGAFAATLSAGGVVVGTPAYMAPEQLEGGAVTPAVDLYALGVVIFEMLTGELPFQGETAIATAVKRLTEPAPSPRDRVADLDPSWEALVLRCLARLPQDRFASASELVTVLDSGATVTLPAVVATSAPPARPAATPRERRTRLLAIGVGIALLLAVASALVRIRNLHQGALPEIPSTARRAVAVLGFRNLSGDAEAAWLSTALAEMLATEISAGHDLRAISGDQVARARRELGLDEGAEIGGPALSRLRAQLGADVVISGAYTVMPGAGGALRLDLRLQEAANGRQLAAFAESGSAAQLFDLVARAGVRAREALGAGALSREEGQAHGAALPANPEAVRLYAEGLEQMRTYSPQAARERFEQAVALDPSFALARSALATTWAALGYEQRAQREAERAHELAARLPREERLLVEARYREAFRDWTRAAEIYSTLWQAFPDSVDYGLRLAAVQISAGAGEQALLTAGALRKLPAPLGEDPRIDLATAAAAGSLADFKTQRASAVRTAEKATAQGVRRLLAEARVTEGWAARNLGDPARAREACEEAGRIFAEVGDRTGQASALTALGGVLFDQGDLGAARARYTEALATFREVGDLSGVARALNNIAVVTRTEGDRGTARRLYEEVLTLCQETGDRAGAAYASNNIATLLSEEGELAGARERLEQTLAVRREIRDQAGVASALGNLGSVLRREGKLADAVRRLEESLSIQREIGQKLGEVASLAGLGMIALDQGELGRAGERFGAALAIAREIGNKSGQAQALAGQGELAGIAADWDEAESRHREALVLRQEIGEKLAGAQSRLSLARVALDRGKPETAEIASRQVLTALGSERLPDLQAQAQALLCRALAARGSGGLAREACSEAKRYATGTQSPQVRLAVAVARARSGVESDRGEMETALTGHLEEARRLGLVALELEIRLALAELSSRGGGRVSTRLTAPLAADARARGFLSLAAQADRIAAN